MSAERKDATAIWSSPATLDAVSEMRTAVGRFASQAGVTDPPLADVRLAVSEAVGNAVIHGYRDEATPGPVQVGADYLGSELRIVVTDRGAGCAPRADSPGMGMGLPIIAAVSDRLEIRQAEPQGTEVHICFKL